MTNDRSAPFPFLCGARAGMALLAAVVAALAATAPAAADVRVEAGGGVFVPFDRDHREVYGSSPAFTLGISSAFGTRGSRVFLDVGHVRGSGDELTFDPTFVRAPDAEYRLLPVTLGLRFDVNSDPDQAFRLFLGLGLRTCFTHWEGIDASESAPTLGLMGELRPELRVGNDWTVWVRQRLDLVRDVDYGAPAPLLDYSAGTLEIGASLGLDGAPLSPPRNRP